MNLEKLKVALVHDYLVQYGGAEKTLEAIAEIFPDAPIYTGVYKPNNLSAFLNSKKILHPKSQILNAFTKYLTFLMPMIYENFDMRDYDIVISDTACWGKGVLTKPGQLHISYIHTPPRFLYKYKVESVKREVWYFKPFIAVIDSVLRVWDYAAAQRPDFIIANSQEVEKRIAKFYRRESKVIYPPVELDRLQGDKQDNKPDSSLDSSKPFYAAVGRLVAYKNFNILVDAFNKLDLPLVVVGTGAEENKLKAMAGKNISFTGRATEEQKHKILESCIGLINPVGDEDFGIVPIEAMSHGKPVLSHSSGGALEMVNEDTGMFFTEPTVEDLIENVTKFDAAVKSGKFDSNKIKQSVQKFSKERFKEEFTNFVLEKWTELKKA